LLRIWGVAVGAIILRCNTFLAWSVPIALDLARPTCVAASDEPFPVMTIAVYASRVVDFHASLSVQEVVRNSAQSSYDAAIRHSVRCTSDDQTRR
jgi:hypothetical protein